jgi:hypothetical protein
MPTFRQDEKLGTKVPLIKTADINDKSITENKLAEGSVTNSKLAPESVTQDKFDKELLQIFEAASCLPRNLIETIQNVDTTLADHQRQISSNDDDISDLQTKTKQIKDTVDGIAVSGGASVGSAVTYDNTQSGLDAQNIQNAIDELVNNLGHYETNEEWLRAYTDAENKFLWGIRVDGSIDWAVGIPRPIQKKIEKLIATDTTILESITQLRTELSESLNNKIQSLKDNEIKNLQDTKVDKEEGKSLIEDEVKECFGVIENEEFLKAIVDSDDKVLFGIYRATGKPYFPLNEMYHVEQNEEFFAVWLDASNHVLLGIRRDGQIIGEIHAVNALKQVISQLQSDVAALQEKVGTIDTNLKELLDVFSLQDNEEYLAVEQDAEGRVLSATYNDGSHYIHNAKSETIPTEFYHIEDPEERTEITTDAENKILGYRDSKGTYHNLLPVSFDSIKITPKGLSDLAKSLKGYGVDIIDWSGEDVVEIPKPTSCAIINLTTDSQAESKTSNIKCYIEFWDKHGNYFKKPIILNAQGSSSMAYDFKNQSLDLDDGSKLKIGNWLPMDSFHLKKFFIDVFRGQCIAGYWLGEQIYQTRPYGQRRPWDYLKATPTGNGSASGNFSEDFADGALSHPDGFPCKVFFNGVNAGIYSFNLKKDRSNYNCNKKNQKNIILDGALGSAFFNADGDSTKGNTEKGFWADFEVRNPKISKDINGNPYDGDSPTEPSEDYTEAKGYITALTKVLPAIKAASTKESKKEIFSKSFNVDFFIDYFLHAQVTYNYDGFFKNWIWLCNDGKLWTPTLYDLDSLFGQHWNGTENVGGTSDILGISEGLPSGVLLSLYKSEIELRYKELRDKAIFSVDNIVYLLEKWINKCGIENLKEDITEITLGRAIKSDGSILENVPVTPSYRSGEYSYAHSPISGGWYNSLSRVRSWLIERISYLDNYFNYNI